MTLAAGRTARAGGVLARDRLASYRRYAELLALQEAAVARGDMDAYAALAEETAALQAALGGHLHPEGLAADPEATSGAFVSELSDLLRSALGANERIQARLRALRADTAGSVRRAREGQRRVREYAGPGAAPDRRLDLTL